MTPRRLSIPEVQQGVAVRPNAKYTIATLPATAGDAILRLLRSRHKGTHISYRTLLTLAFGAHPRISGRPSEANSILQFLTRRFPVLPGTWRMIRGGGAKGPVFRVREPGWPPSKLIGDGLGGRTP